MSNLKWFLFLGFSCFLATILSAQPLAELIKRYDQTFSANEPGGTVLIKKGEQVIWQQNYGIADQATNEKVTENTLVLR